MKQDYFVLVLAHSLHGRLRRVHVPHKVVYGIVCARFLRRFFGVRSCVQLCANGVEGSRIQSHCAMKRKRYALAMRNLQRSDAQAHEQLATLQMFASEVSSAYGVKARIEGPDNVASEARLAPTMSETLATYNTLRTFGGSHYDSTFFANDGEGVIGMLSGSWPVDGRITSPVWVADRSLLG